MPVRTKSATVRQKQILKKTQRSVTGREHSSKHVGDIRVSCKRIVENGEVKFGGRGGEEGREYWRMLES